MTLIEVFRKTKSNLELEDSLEALIVTANMLSYRVTHFVMDNKLYIFFVRQDKKYQLSIFENRSSLIKYGDYGEMGKRILDRVDFEKALSVTVEKL